MEKQRTLYQQARLHDRGAAEMVLQMISASKGNNLCSIKSIHDLHIIGIMLYIYRMYYVIIPMRYISHITCIWQ